MGFGLSRAAKDRLAGIIFDAAAPSGSAGSSGASLWAGRSSETTTLLFGLVSLLVDDNQLWPALVVQARRQKPVAGIFACGLGTGLRVTQLNRCGDMLSWAFQGALFLALDAVHPAASLQVGLDRCASELLLASVALVRGISSTTYHLDVLERASLRLRMR